jgi:hypothetical protein
MIKGGYKNLKTHSGHFMAKKLFDSIILSVRRDKN